MNRWALVVDGHVSNVVIWDGDENRWSPGDGVLAVPLDQDAAVATGWTYAIGAFTPPEQDETHADALARARRLLEQQADPDQPNPTAEAFADAVATMLLKGG